MSALLSDAMRVRSTLEAQRPVARQVRTIAKLSGLTVDKTNAALRVLADEGKAERTEYGLWVAT